MRHGLYAFLTGSVRICRIRAVSARSSTRAQRCRSWLFQRRVLHPAVGPQVVTEPYPDGDGAPGSGDQDL